MNQSLILEPPVVTGLDLKSFRQGLRMSVDAFAGYVNTTRQTVARLERLERPLTSDEVRSTMPRLIRYNPVTMKVIQSIEGKAH